MFDFLLTPISLSQ